MNDDEIGHVYIICRADFEGPLKVGHSKNVFARMKSLQQSSPFPLEFFFVFFFPDVAMAKAVEEAFHRWMKRYRVRGEWYEVAPMVALYNLAGIVDSYLRVVLGFEGEELAKVKDLCELKLANEILAKAREGRVRVANSNVRQACR